MLDIRYHPVECATDPHNGYTSLLFLHTGATGWMRPAYKHRVQPAGLPDIQRADITHVSPVRHTAPPLANCTMDAYIWGKPGHSPGPSTCARSTAAGLNKAQRQLDRPRLSSLLQYRPLSHTLHCNCDSALPSSGTPAVMSCLTFCGDGLKGHKRIGSRKYRHHFWESGGRLDRRDRIGRSASDHRRQARVCDLNWIVWDCESTSHTA